MGYQQLDTAGCTATYAAELLADLKITACPINNSPGSNVVVSAIITNVGNTNNNSFVVGCTIARSDNGQIVHSMNSGNMDLAVGESTNYSTSFSMPNCNVDVAFDVQADPAFNY